MKNWAIILSTILMILMLVTSADNYGSANGQVLGGDDISNVTYPRMKLIQGIDGTNDGDISSANPLYVVDAAGATAIESTSGLLPWRALTSVGKPSMRTLRILTFGLDLWTRRFT